MKLRKITIKCEDVVKNILIFNAHGKSQTYTFPFMGAIRKTKLNFKMYGLFHRVKKSRIIYHIFLIQTHKVISLTRIGDQKH